jgi:hypothetical protein
MLQRIALLLLALVTLVSSADAATPGTKNGKIELQSTGPLAFGPEGVLLVGDTKAATIYAIDTAESKANPANARHSVTDVTGKIAGLLGTSPDGIQIVDMAVNPETGTAYFSVGRGRGSDATPVLIRLISGKFEHFKLDQVAFSKAELPNAPADKVTGQGRRKANKRLMSITDMAYIDNRVIVSGLSNEEFASNLRSFEFPFENSTAGASIEIFHGAHGRYETRSPVRTFVPFNIDGEPHVVAAYTCTPLVKFPVAQLTDGEKVRGTTIAELGNHNRPLDMIAYRKDGKDYLLMSNSARGVMKISTDKLDGKEGITKKVGGDGLAGQNYDTVKSLKDIVQLDKLNDHYAVVLVQAEGKSANLETIPLP